MIAAVVLPAVPSLGVDFSEDAVPRVIVSLENGSVSGRECGFGTPLGHRCVAVFCIIGPIGGYLRHVPFDGFEEIRKHFAVVPVCGSDFEPDHVLGRFILGQMNFALGAAFADTMLANLPFTFTKNLQTRRIDHDRDRPIPGTTRNLNGQGARTTRQVGVSGTGRSSGHRRISDLSKPSVAR